MGYKYGLKLTIGIFETLIPLIMIAGQCRGQAYNQSVKIFKDKLSADSYFPKVKPLLDQSEVLNVTITFHLLSIISVNDVQQTFICNGYVTLAWTDQIVAWNPADYGGEDVIYAETKDIWRPRFTLDNTIGERFIFKDEQELLTVNFDGCVEWFPSSIFSTSCSLDMYKYPFDRQTCTLELQGVGWTNEGVRFVPAKDKVSINQYLVNGEWDLLDTSVANSDSDFIHFSFSIKRRPMYLLINVILPVVILSLMNIIVFLIPSDSGEKIGYGITVLLALSVYLSTVSSQLPRSSARLPLVVIYVFTLFIISVLTVIDTIIVVLLCHLDKLLYSSKTEKVLMTRVRSEVSGTMAMAYLNRQKPSPIPTRGNNQEIISTKPVKDKYQHVGKYLNIASFIFFLLLWLAVTLGFLIFMSS